MRISDPGFIEACTLLAVMVYVFLLCDLVRGLGYPGKELFCSAAIKGTGCWLQYLWLHGDMLKAYLNYTWKPESRSSHTSLCIVEGQAIRAR